MARIKKINIKGKGRKGKERKGKDTIKTHKKCYISHPCRRGPNDVIFTKFGTVVDSIFVITYANLDCYRLKGWHSAAVQNLPFSHDFNGWPYNRQALKYCRDDRIIDRISSLCKIKPMIFFE